MVSAATRKTLRDLSRQRAQVIAVGVTVMFGVALFIASAGAFRNLSASYQHTYDRLHFADAVATGGDVERVAAAARSAGATVSIRSQADRPLLIDGTKLLGRVVGLPGDGQPQVDAVDVTSGADGVLVERHAADTFGLRPGDTVEVYAAGGWQRVTVTGIAVSAEYLWPARNRQDVLGDPHGFAVVFVPERIVREWTGAGPNQVLAEVPAGTPTQPLVAAMRGAGAADVTEQADQPSHATLKEDLDGFSELAIAFPLLFLTAAAVAAYVLLARRVLAERPVIGVLAASGARPGRIVRHYLQQGVLTGLAGGVAGAVLGVVGTGVVTRAYTRALNIPDTVVEWRPGLAVAGIAFSVLVGLAGAAAPAVAAARTSPAAAMRNQTVSRPPGRWSRYVAGLRVLPVSARMALRDVFRNLRRTAATMLGAVLALVLMLAAIGMLSSLSRALDLQYGQIERQDATVTAADAGTADTEARLRSVPGVTAVEQSRTGQVTAANGAGRYTTELHGLRPGTGMHRFRTASGWTSLPPDGILAGAALADRLHLSVGDTLTLTASTGRPARVRLSGLVSEPVGTAVYSTNATAARILPEARTSTFLVRFADGADRDAVRRQVTGMPSVVAYADTRAVTASIDRLLALFWAFIAVMVVLGAILAATVIYVTMAVNVVERTSELATLEAAGVPDRRVAATIATENLVATALGIPIGLAAGVLAAKAFLASFSSDLFQIDLAFGWWALPAAAVAVAGAAALSQWPAVRAVRRVDIARVVRERAQ